MLKEIKYSWDEIYIEWGYLANKFSNIKEKLSITKIKINQWSDENSYFYGYDWIDTFCNEVEEHLPDNWRGEGFSIVQAIQDVAFSECRVSIFILLCISA